MQIRIICYNVLRGFHKKIDGDFVFEPSRLQAAQKIINSFDPDILVLGEADFNTKNTYRSEKTKTLAYQSLFGFPHMFQVAITERKGEVILSKLPFQAESFSTEQFSHTRAVFKIEGKEVMLDFIHPYPRVPEKEKATWLAGIVKTAQKPYVLLGDFNALSPQDEYVFENVAEGFHPARGDGAEANARDALQGLMIQEVIAQGMVDAYRSKHTDPGHTYPTFSYQPVKEWKGTMRLDYIFCSSEFKILESGIIKDEYSEKASDHYPLFAVLKI